MSHLKTLKRKGSLTDQQVVDYQTAVSHRATRRDIARLPGVDVSKVPTPQVVPAPFRSSSGQLLHGESQEGGWTKISVGATAASRGLPSIERHEAAHHVLWQQGVKSKAGEPHHPIMEAARAGGKKLNFSLLRPATAAFETPTSEQKGRLSRARQRERLRVVRGKRR